MDTETGESAMAMSKHPYHWIEDAMQNRGTLREKLGVKPGRDISEKKLEMAERSKAPKVAKEARLAETLKNMRKK
jgi:hypothetical protein